MCGVLKVQNRAAIIDAPALSHGLAASAAPESTTRAGSPPA